MSSDPSSTPSSPRSMPPPYSRRQPSDQPWRNYIYIVNADYALLKARCTCGDFEVSIPIPDPEGIPLDVLTDNAPIRQHREFHSHQDPGHIYISSYQPEPGERVRAMYRYMAGLQRESSPTSLIGHGTGQPGAAQYVGSRSDPIEVAMHHLATVLFWRADELDAEIRRQDEVLSESGFPDPHSDWAGNFRNELRYLAAIIDPMTPQQERERLRP